MIPSLLRKLDRATGRAEHAIVVFADVRGFSEFSQQHEAQDIALYVRRVYSELLGRYFSEATFAQPTGDGLLLVFRHQQDPDALTRIGRRVIVDCLRCLSEFPSICESDLLINFNCPRHVGFGIARGPVCCLRSGGRIVTYSGHILNLAARLMDLARPSGVVIDGQFDRRLLSKDQSELFDESQVFLRGIAESDPRRIFYLRDHVTIPARARVAPSEVTWRTETHSLTKKQLSGLGGALTVPLQYQPRSGRGMRFTLSYSNQRMTRAGKPTQRTLPLRSARYERRAGRPKVVFGRHELTELVRKARLPRDAIIQLRVEYQVEPQELRPESTAEEQLEDVAEDARELTQRVRQARPPFRANRTNMVSGTEANARLMRLGLMPSASDFEFSRYRWRKANDAIGAMRGLLLELEGMARNIARFRNIRDAHLTMSSLLRRIISDGGISRHQFQLARSIVSLCSTAIREGVPPSIEVRDQIFNAMLALRNEYISWLSLDPKVHPDNVHKK